VNSPIHIVLDKSYLQGCNRYDLHEISTKYRLLLCAETFHEVVSSSQEELQACFTKLVTIGDSLDLLEHNGTLLRYEIENTRSCKPISDHILHLASLNREWNLSIPKYAIETITEFHEYWEIHSAEAFDEVVLEIARVCGRVSANQISSDRNIVLKAYRTLRSSEHLPDPDHLNEDWAIYRRLHVDLMAAYEYMDCSQDGQICIREERKSHNQIDFRIVVAACLAGGVATRDKLIARYFKKLCPEGVLYWLGR
jgi:hypothetical protein